MKCLGELARRLQMLVHRRQFDADLEEEMRFHALSACYIPAQRATRVDPMTALRCE